MTNHLFLKNITKNCANRLQGDVQTVPKVAQTLPRRSIRAPSDPKSDLGPSFLRLFLNFLHDLGPRALKVASGVQLYPKTTLRTTKNMTNIHIYFGKLNKLFRTSCMQVLQGSANKRERIVVKHARGCTSTTASGRRRDQHHEKIK